MHNAKSDYLKRMKLKISIIYCLLSHFSPAVRTHNLFLFVPSPTCCIRIHTIFISHSRNRQCLQSTDPETCSKAADSSCVWLPFHNICQNSNVDFDKPEEKPTEENLDVGTDCVGLGLNNWVYTANDGSKHTADITLEDNFYLDVKGKQYFFIMPRTQAAMYPTPHDYTTVYDHMCSRKTTDGRNGYAACCKCLNPLHTKKMTSAAAEVYKYRIGHPKNNDSSCTAPPGPFILEQYARFSSQDGNTIFIESSWTTNASSCFLFLSKR